MGTVLMDLSKSYNCLPHDLLIVKLAAYGFEDSATSLISDYLSKRYQRVKIGSVFSSYLEVLGGGPQGLILGLILFNPIQEGHPTSFPPVTSTNVGISPKTS